jgi:hypothetical protein
MKTKLVMLVVFLCSSAAWAEHQPPAALEGDYARLTIYRPSAWQGSAWANPYCVDGQTVAELKNNGYTWIQVKPGVHQLSFCRGGPSKTLTMSVNFKAGGEYYLRQGPEIKDMPQYVLAPEQQTQLTESRNVYAAGITLMSDSTTTFALMKDEFALKELVKFKYKEPLIKSVEEAKQ